MSSNCKHGQNGHHVVTTKDSANKCLGKEQAWLALYALHQDTCLSRAEFKIRCNNGDLPLPPSPYFSDFRQGFYCPHAKKVVLAAKNIKCVACASGQLRQIDVQVASVKTYWPVTQAVFDFVSLRVNPPLHSKFVQLAEQVRSLSQEAHPPPAVIYESKDAQKMYEHLGWSKFLEDPRFRKTCMALRGFTEVVGIATIPVEDLVRVGENARAAMTFFWILYSGMQDGNRQLLERVAHLFPQSSIDDAPDLRGIKAQTFDNYALTFAQFAKFALCVHRSDSNVIKDRLGCSLEVSDKIKHLATCKCTSLFK